MKRFAALFALVTFAFATPTFAVDTLVSNQPLSNSAPTAASEGMSLGGVRGFRVSVCAQVGQTLSGTGTLLAYWYDSVAALWMRNPALDWSVTATGVRCQVFPDQRVVAASAGRVFYATSALTVSGGTTAATRIYPSAVQP